MDGKEMKREKFDLNKFELVPEYEYRNVSAPGCFPNFMPVKVYRLQYRDPNGALVEVKMS
jgi:hypothetical protein